MPLVKRAIDGPVSAVQDNIVIFDDSTGKKLKDSGKALSDYVEEGDARLTDARDPTAHDLDAHGAVTLAELNAVISDATLATDAAATTSVAGLMSAADKVRLDAMADSANNYVHPNHSGDVTSVADGATTIANNAVTNTKLADMATKTVKGRNSDDTGDPEDLAMSTLKTMLGATSTATASSIPIADGSGKLDSAWIKDATTSTKGVVQVAAPLTVSSGTVGLDANLSRTTVAVTSTDAATSATAAPLKSAGGMAVAKNAIVGESAHIRRQFVDGQIFTVVPASTMRVTFTSSFAQQILAGGIDIIARMGSVASISGAAWRLYGSLIQAGEFLVHQVHKTEATNVTISAPTWRSTTTFSIDVTNANASNALTCVINANLSIGSSALLSMTVAAL